MQGVAQSPLAIRAGGTRAAVKGRFSWNRSANVFDLELPGVEGSERRGFVVFMQKILNNLKELEYPVRVIERVIAPDSLRGIIIG